MDEGKYCRCEGEEFAGLLRGSAGEGGGLVEVSDRALNERNEHFRGNFLHCLRRNVAFGLRGGIYSGCDFGLAPLKESDDLLVNL